MTKHKVNHDLVSTKITKSSKQKLEVVKASLLLTDPTLANSDYAMLGALIDCAYDHAVTTLPAQG